MNYSEKWGKDVDEAVRLALEDLGATEDQIKVTVIEEPSKGFLGLGAKLAKVRVELMEDEEPPVKKGREQKRTRDNKNNTSDNKMKRDLRKKNKPQQGSQAGKPSGNQARGGHQGRNERPQRRERTYENNYKEIDISGKASLSEKPNDLIAAEDSDAAKFLKSLIENMGIEVDIKAFRNDECFYIEISGKDSRTIIGKRGQTLDSIQYLTNLVVNKDREDYIRSIIDVEGYRSRREKTLEQLGVKLAMKVQKTGRSVKLEPMNPYERKVIHSTLQGIAGICTRSEGEEPYRRVIIERKR